MHITLFILSLFTVAASCGFQPIDAHEVQTIIFAAGQSKRFEGPTSKLLTPICNGKPIIYYPVKAVDDLNLPITVVIGHQGDELKQTLSDLFPNTIFDFVLQEKRLGTGHALQCSKQYWHAHNIMVLNGDHPLTSSSTLHKLIVAHQQENADITLLITRPKTKCNWGRIVKTEHSISIVEAADFHDNPDDHPFVNAGFYIFKRDFLEQNIDTLQLHTNKGEYYVTDLIEIASQHHLKIHCVEVPFTEVFGINTQEEFHYAQNLLKQKYEQC